MRIFGGYTVSEDIWWPVFRIRMDPGFFANPDPDQGLESPDPDPSINKLMGS